MADCPLELLGNFTEDVPCSIFRVGVQAHGICTCSANQTTLQSDRRKEFSFRYRQSSRRHLLNSEKPSYDNATSLR